MKILFLLMAMLISSVKIMASTSVVTVAAPIKYEQNVENCKKFAWWWYITPDMVADSKQYALIQADALKSGCNIGAFCGRCGPFTCTLKEKYYACRNLCENNPTSPQISLCLTDGKMHSLFYHIQLIKGMVPMPAELLDPNKKLVWARAFYPQMDKQINIGWDAKNDTTSLLQGVPLPFDIPQVAFSGGVFPKLGIDKLDPGMVLTTTTDGHGYIHLTTTADLLNSPMGYAIYQQGQVVKGALTSVPQVSYAPAPQISYVNPSPTSIPVAVPVK